MTGSDVTLGELARRLDVLHSDLKDLRSAVVERDDLANASNGWLASLTGHEKSCALQLGAMDARVASLEAWQTWGLRILAGAVLSAVIALVLVTQR